MGVSLSCSKLVMNVHKHASFLLSVCLDVHLLIVCPFIHNILTCPFVLLIPLCSCDRLPTYSHACCINCFMLIFCSFSCPSFLSCTQPNVDRHHSLPTKTTAPYLNGVRHLLDDSVLEMSPCASSDGSISKGMR